MPSSQCLPGDTSRELQKDEIRLLRFLPRIQNDSSLINRDSDDDVCLEMQTFKRSEAPRYLALSYVWGAQGSERAIVLNEQLVKIRVNLHAALKRLRSQMGCQNLWPNRSGSCRSDWLYSEESSYDFGPRLTFTGRPEQALRMWLQSVQQRQDHWITHRLHTALVLKLPSLHTFGVNFSSTTRDERTWARELQKKFIDLYSDAERHSLLVDIDSPSHKKIACTIADHYMLSYSIQSNSIRFCKQELPELRQPVSPSRSEEGMSGHLLESTCSSEASPDIMDFIFDSDPYLRHMAEHFGSPYLWIDALCIDQNNTRERNDQVKVMDQIFRDALGVIAWLGELEPAHFPDLSSHRKYLLIPRSSWQPVRINIATEDSAPVRDFDWAALGEGLACSTLFTRMWCAQEIVVPQSLTFLCSSYVVSMDAIASLLNEAKSRHPGVIFDRMTHSLAARSNFSASKGASLTYLLDHFGDAECSDPRDKIFALLGLLKPDDGFRDIFPDYRLTEKDVVLRAIAQFRRQHAGPWAAYAVAESTALLLKAFDVPVGRASAIQVWLCTQPRPTTASLTSVPEEHDHGDDYRQSFRYRGQSIKLPDSVLTGSDLIRAFHGDESLNV